MNQNADIKSFEEFWPFYVREHSKPGCRLLHFIGSTAGLMCLVLAAFLGNPWLLPLGFVVGYGFAWTIHAFIQRNRPATFKYPLWSFMADWKMWKLTLLGRMGGEVQRALNLA